MRISAKKLFGALMVLYVGVEAQGWTATLAFNAFSNIVGGANAIAASCPKSPQGSCAVGAIQTVVGSLLAIAAGANAFFGFWKRDENGVATFVLTTDAAMAGAEPISHDDLKAMARTGPVRMQVLLKGDSSPRHAAYHFNNDTGHHKVYARYDGMPVNVMASKSMHDRRQEETIDGDDGFVGDFNDMDIDDWEQTDASSDAASNYANQIESQLESNNADSVCVGFSDGSMLDSQLRTKARSKPGAAKRHDLEARQDGPFVQANIYSDPECQQFVLDFPNVPEQGQCAQIANFRGALIVQGGVNCQTFTTLDCTGEAVTPAGASNTFWGSTAGACAGFETIPGSFSCVEA
ncbi:hypothetical protein CONLIGDRAFT_676935 [Coniochaeta ligniaria NRRL 30616]|uniref:Uncharacterized protein n=1 Tax=Coniochaeta ligniaria NRRL 30616 TaxID=1408157 RepID=A0A1J7JZ62_9PEZI|nr:hypothetical protein CONLIGDRAFT_676935 [Coniochaeta ligniaria NRRL 30616]